MANTGTARIPPAMVYAPVDIPDEIHPAVLDVVSLPRDWFVYPAPVECQLAGDSWIRRGEAVALVVPSAVARIESNVLLNPLHRDFARLTIGDIETMAIDDRLIR